MTLPLKTAQHMVAAALAAGCQAGVPTAVAVVDRGGHLVAAARSDDVGPLTLAVAQRKAATAINFGVSTHVLLDMIKDDPVQFAALNAEPAFSVLPGGVPIVVDGAVIGAIGVAGAHYAQDHAIAETALAD